MSISRGASKPSVLITVPIISTYPWPYLLADTNFIDGHLLAMAGSVAIPPRTQPTRSFIESRARTYHQASCHIRQHVVSSRGILAKSTVGWPPAPKPLSQDESSCGCSNMSQCACRIRPPDRVADKGIEDQLQIRIWHEQMADR